MSTVNYSHNESPFLTNVRLIESDMEIEEVSRQVFIWRDKVVSLIKPSLRRSEKLDVLKDLLHVLCDYEAYLPGIQLRLWSVVVAKDSDEKIQSITVFQFRNNQIDPAKQELFVGCLASAPWNIKSLSSCSFEEPPVSGGGIMLMHALDSIGRSRSSCDRIYLHSTGTGFGFYKRIGMEQEHMLNSFFIDFSNPGQKEELEKALCSSFGKHFSYSLE